MLGSGAAAKAAGVGILLEQRRRDHVHPLVGALGREDRGDQQLETACRGRARSRRRRSPWRGGGRSWRRGALRAAADRSALAAPAAALADFVGGCAAGCLAGIRRPCGRWSRRRASGSVGDGLASAHWPARLRAAGHCRRTPAANVDPRPEIWRLPMNRHGGRRLDSGPRLRRRL